MASRSKAPFGGFLTVLLLFAVIAQGSLASAAGEFALVGGRILLPDGSLAEGKAVVIGIDGKIERIIPAADIGELPKKVLPEGSVLSPGLHDLLGGFGAGEAVERTRLFDPEVRAVEAVDSTSETLTLARGYGVLHATVAPAPVNLVNGRTVTFICNTAPTLAVLAEGPQVLALGESVLDPLREPTSRGGALLRMRQWLETESGKQTLAEPLAPLMYCLEAADLRQVLTLFENRSLPVLIHRGDGRSPAGKWCQDQLVVVGPLTVRSSPSEAMVCARFQRRGAEIAFLGGLPTGPGDALRRSAAMAVAAGLELKAARRGLTSNPARVAGISEIGRIASGCRADLVLFSGDPVDMASQVLAVWLGGVEEPVGKVNPIPKMEARR